VLEEPVTVAMNCCCVSVAVEGATTAKVGEIEMATTPAGPVMMIMAMPLFVGSAALVAVTVTGFAAGTAAGARKSTLPEAGDGGEMQGFEPDSQIWPTVVLPLGVPLTDQVTAVSEVLVTTGVREVRRLISRVTALGVMLTVTALTMVTAAEAVMVPATAWIVTVLGEGREAGAV